MEDKGKKGESKQGQLLLIGFSDKPKRRRPFLNQRSTPNNTNGANPHQSNRLRDRLDFDFGKEFARASEDQGDAQDDAVTENNSPLR